MQRKKSLFPLVFAVLTAFALLIGTLDVFVYAKYIRGGRLYKLRHPAEKVDMTDPDGNTDYGRIYYSPVDEEHIVEYEDASGCGYIDNEVLVVANDGVSREQIAELAAKYDAEIVGEIEVSGDYQLRLTTTPEELDTVVESISAEPAVASAEVNYVMPLSGDSAGDVGDFYYGNEWQKELTSSTYDSSKALSWGFHEINTPMAWALLAANKDVVNPVKVGVSDCGFSDTHPDLGFVSIFYDNGDHGMTTKKFYIDSGRDHGTHVSGTFAANTDDGTGICGVYPYGNGRLYAACVSRADKYSNDIASNRATTMGTKAAFAELIVRNVKVINFSVGFNDYSFQYNDLWHKKTSKTAKSLAGFYDRMLKKGYDFVISASAGNSSSTLTGHLEAKYNSSLCLIEQSDYPDVYNRIIVVGSLDRDLSISEFSNGGNRTEIYAPGGDIYSALYSDLHSGELYGSKNGTSMAAPHVAGVAAMVWSANASLTGEEVKNIVISTADTSKTSVPVLDAAAAVQTALNGSTFAPHLIHTNAAIIGKVCKIGLIDSPIEEATITATECNTKNEYTAKSDLDGQFDILLPAGKYIFTIEADGYKTYTSEVIELSDNSVYNAKTIKLKKDKVKSSGGGSGKTETTTAPAKETPEIGKIYTGEDIKKFLPDKFGKFDIGIGLDKIRAWTYYEGHYYAIFDHAMSARVMSLATQQDPDVHLVTITSDKEQQLIEELMLYGDRDVYYTGGMANSDGDVYTVNGEDTDYTHWYEGCPENYGKEGKDDIIAIYRGTIEDPKSSPDYGYWFDLNEDEYNLFDFVDFNVEGATRGIIIEWDKSVNENSGE